MPNPGLRRHEGRAAQRQRWDGAQTIRKAAPRPVLRAADQPCSQSVPLDVPADAEQPIRSGYCLQGEALRIYRGTMQTRTSALQPDGVGSCYPCDQPRESRRTRCTEHEMPVIVHDAVRKQRKWMTLQPFTHNLQEVPIILRSEQQRRRERSSMNHMKVAVGVCLPGGSQHGVGLCH